MLGAMGGGVGAGTDWRDGGGHLGGISWFAMRQDMADLFVQPALRRGRVPARAINVLAAFAITISVTVIILIYVLSCRWHEESCVLLLFAIKVGGSADIKDEEWSAPNMMTVTSIEHRLSGLT